MDEGELKRRKFKRIDSLNLVSYIHYNEKGNPDYEGAARTLDLSENGILLDTGIEFDKNTVVEMEIAIEEKILKIKGIILRVVKQEDSIHLGVQFIETSEEVMGILKRFIQD